MHLEATSRPADDYDANPHRWTIDAADYDTAMGEVEQTLTPGHVLLHVRTI